MQRTFRVKAALLTLMTAVALSALFFDPLWRGGGFVGGDVYSYYFPQKSFYADCLSRGELPLWNPLVAHGYPVLGESQTGVLYPPNVLAYSLLDVHAAYHVNHLLHYVMAFAFTVLFARRMGLSGLASGLAGVVYVYGWFPARTCWEWAIVGGAWLPLALWATDRVMESGRIVDALVLGSVLALQMLPGHEHIAFLTQLTVVGWALVRCFPPTEKTAAAATIVEWASPTRTRGVLLIGLALACGFALAAVQLVPMAELLRRSQRSELGEHHNPARGALPWRNLTMAAGWVRVEDDAESGAAETSFSWQPWCSPLIDQNDVLQKSTPSTPTNKTEAGMYFGVVPFGLALLGCGFAVRDRKRTWIAWMLLGLLSAAYATGSLVPLMQRFPGFGWFHGPGRYGLITTLSAALLAGFGFDSLAGRTSERGASGTLSSWWPLGFLGAWMAFAFLTITAVSAAVEHSIELTKAASPLKLFGREVGDGAVLVLVAAAVVATIVSLGMMGRDPGPAEGRRRSGSGPLFAVIVGTTLLDLWMASRLLTYSPMLNDPPFRHRAESPVGRLLHDDPQCPATMVRLQSLGGNLPSVLGVPFTPGYFTFGPQEYSGDQRLPDLVPGRPSADVVATARSQWERAGITHVLTVRRLEASAWGLEQVWSGIDPFLNPSWAMGSKPLFLYRVAGTKGRAWFVPSPTTAGGSPDRLESRDAVVITESTPNRVVMAVDASRPGEVVLTDLWYRGWTATVDGAPAEAKRYDEMFRAVEVLPGKHVVAWTFRPASVYWGGAVSLAAAVAMCVAACRAMRKKPVTAHAASGSPPLHTTDSSP